MEEIGTGERSETSSSLDRHGSPWGFELGQSLEAAGRTPVGGLNTDLHGSSKHPKVVIDPGKMGELTKHLSWFKQQWLGINMEKPSAMIEMIYLELSGIIWIHLIKNSRHLHDGEMDYGFNFSGFFISLGRSSGPMTSPKNKFSIFQHWWQ